MMFSREGWRLEMGQAENCVKMSTKFRKFSIKNTDRGFILYNVAVTSQGRKEKGVVVYRFVLY